ncbi:Transthyretin-like family protein [Necator americanus]|uniref:Transthyretin-like family protein n=1 Tax=Necator americanus TaxID=51031 RepID=W2TBZ2_NECAM|nr:Transthyretin-like family protein [Necator americanus]ETN78711.1 Transthyretin-like family protein [Necator americanus]
MFVNILIALALVVAANAHSITVRGVFECDDDKRLPVFVKLMERDSFHDDLLKWKQVRVYDDFEIKGTEDEAFGFTPYLEIMHTCREIPETIIVNFGTRVGDVEIDLGNVYLDDTKIKEKMFNQFIL